MQSYLKVLDDVEPSVANMVPHHLDRHKTRRAGTETEANPQRGERGHEQTWEGAMEIDEQPLPCSGSTITSVIRTRTHPTNEVSG